MKSLKWFIIVLIMLTVGISVVLIVLNVKSGDTANTNVPTQTVNKVIDNTLINDVEAELQIETTEKGEAPILTFNTDLQQITSNSMLYSISNNINKYFNYIKEGNILAINELGGNTSYIIQNNAKYIVKQAYSTENAYMTRYYTYGILTVANGDYTTTEQEVFIIVYLTGDNKGYKLETITQEEFNNMKALEDEEKIEIVQGTYNIYEYEYVNSAKQMEIYLKDYSFYMLNDINKAYNLLEEEYRTNRFKDINEFREYVLNNQYRVQNVEITQYDIIDEDDNTIYVGKDEKGNYYKVIVKSYMDYTIILDNYTIIDEYDELDDDEKIEVNVERFISMLNSKDYTNAYNLLEPNFKETYFKTEQDFINYVQQNFFERNIIASKELNEDNTCAVSIRETISTRSNKIQKTFKVNLLEEEFNIEFDI